ncbi:unnamed protein product [Rhizoctonia solani]|uniref:GH18 domain-containing protein n=1 Tax=Rhizoctonia solani TaxID=456999 RepID=A0A8H2WXE6_9AGAM|nr:unnamed protein product [Rhizoctonia solani]
MRLILLLSLYAGIALATEIMHRPANFRTKFTPNTPVKYNPFGRFNAGAGGRFDGGGKVNIGYFPNWGIYSRGFTPAQIDTDSLTHIYYAFADTDPATGRAFLSDPWADQQITYPGDDKSAPGNNLYVSPGLFPL